MAGLQFLKYNSCRYNCIPRTSIITKVSCNIKFWGYYPSCARVIPKTFPAPLCFKIFPHSRKVAPVVVMSSTKIIFLPFILFLNLGFRAKAPFRFSFRASFLSSNWGFVCLILVIAFGTYGKDSIFDSSIPKSSDWLYPLFLSLETCNGTAVTKTLLFWTKFENASCWISPS